jgi:hypothetical protein
LLNNRRAVIIGRLYQRFASHKVFARIVCRIPGWKWDSTYEEFYELAKTLRGVAFVPKYK